MRFLEGERARPATGVKTASGKAGARDAAMIPKLPSRSVKKRNGRRRRHASAASL